MCSINHDLKAIFIHVHKTGGTYISYMLHKHYGFKNYYLRRPDHDSFCLNLKKTTKYINYENRLHGVLMYYKTSPYINKKMNMTSHKWNTYYKFCFIRNPYDKIVSAWNHVNRFNIPFKNYLNLTNTCNDVEYIHIFMPQCRNIINEKGLIDINYIGKFENLEEDFQTVLRNIGVKNIKHDVNKKMNKREHMEFYEYYDQETLNIVNHLLKEDFRNLDYPFIDNIDLFKSSFELTTEYNEIQTLECIDNYITLLQEQCSSDDSMIPYIEPHLEESNTSFSKQNQNKIVVFYAYFEKDKNYKYNFIYFLNNALLEHIDYVIIINGYCSVDIPQKPNIKILTRENKGFDFGAYSYAVNHLNDIKYNYYFFINTSVIGPFLTKYNNETSDWTLPFLNLFKNNVKLVGTSINIYQKNNIPFSKYDLSNIYVKNNPFIHIQTMFFALDHEFFTHLKCINFFNENELNNKDFNYVIAYKEIGLSQIAFKNNWNINCILDKYKDIDYLNLKHDINPYSKNGDPYYKNTYFGKSIEKDDVIFYKLKRFI